MWYSTSQKVKQLGGAVVDSHKEATHLVMSEAVRTIKLLCCLSTCKYILSEAWIRDSHAHNTFLGKISEFKMVVTKYVAWHAYGLNCCSCQWSYPVFWIFTDFIFFPFIWLQNAEKFSDNVFLLVPNVRASTGVHPSFSVGASGCLAWIKSDHSHPCRAEIKNNWRSISTPPYACMVWRYLYFAIT